ncbi:MAG: S-layer homology domain-containing protein [Defluviitaleaceae bacterium]|nr:S-layer homology domain-containing protein [Defluviitaleaceae bacterium]
MYGRIAGKLKSGMGLLITAALLMALIAPAESFAKGAGQNLNPPHEIAKLNFLSESYGAQDDVYEISFGADTTDPIDFGNRIFGGYSYPPRYFTITNEGNRPTGNLAISITGINPSSFRYVVESIASLEPGASNSSLFIFPRNNLGAGTYNATLTVSNGVVGEGAILKSFGLTFTIEKAPQTLAAADITAAAGDPPKNLENHAASSQANAANSGAITYSVVDAGSTGASVASNGITLSFSSPGTAIIAAAAAGSANYEGASVEFTLTVTGALIYSTAVYVPSVNGSPPAGAFVNPPDASAGTRVNLPHIEPFNGFAFGKWEVASGAVEIINEDSADDAYFYMGSGDVVIYALFKAATLSFIDQRLPDATFGSFYHEFITHPNGGSGDYSYSGVPPAGLVILGGSIYGTPEAAGENQAFELTVTDVTTGATAKATVTITVNKANQTLSSAGQITRVIGADGNAFDLTGFAASSAGEEGGAVTYTVEAAGNGAGASVYGSTLFYSEIGTSTLRAEAAGDKNYNPASVTITLRVVESDFAGAADPIAFETPDSVTKTFGDAPFANAVTGAHSGTGAIRYASSDASTAGVDAEGVVTIYQAGAVTITATKDADGYYAGAFASYVLTVKNASQAAPIIGKTDETGAGANDGTITGVSGAMEYKKDGDAHYVPVAAGESSITGLAPGQYLVRFMAKPNHDAGQDAIITIGAFNPARIFTVFFDAEGGFAASNSIQTDANGYLLSIPSASREGYVFLGWYSERMGWGTMITLGHAFLSDTVVYARWAIDERSQGSAISQGQGQKDPSQVIIMPPPPQLLPTTAPTQAPTQAPQPDENASSEQLPDPGTDPEQITDEEPTDVGGPKLETPDGNPPIANPDGSLTLPYGGTLDTQSGAVVTLPPGTVIDGSRAILPHGSGGAKIDLDNGLNFDIDEGFDIFFGDDYPLGYFVDAGDPFYDVGEDDWYYRFVMFVYAHGLMDGTETGVFNPGRSMTRGMIVTVLHALAGNPTADGITFSDVGGDSIYAESVAWAASVGLIFGYGDGRFGPDDEITRQDLAVLLGRFADFIGIELPELRGAPSFQDDADSANYAKDAIERFFRAGIINGKAGGVFDPGGEAVRAEFAAMLKKFLTL